MVDCLHFSEFNKAHFTDKGDFHSKVPKYVTIVVTIKKYEINPIYSFNLVVYLAYLRRGPTLALNSTNPYRIPHTHTYQPPKYA